MDPQRISRLTEQQRVCLRHVYAHLTSKEIAPLLGIRPASVDQYIKDAMRTLGVQDRRSAARILAEHENLDPTRQTAYQSPGIVVRAPDSEAGLPSEGAWQANSQRAPSPGSLTRLLPGGGIRPGDLDWRARLMWIAGIAIGMALAFGVLVSAVDALARILDN